MKKYKVNRDVTAKECFWLKETVKEDTVVHEWTGGDYGCVTSNGTAVTVKPWQTPFFELPTNSLEVQ